MSSKFSTQVDFHLLKRVQSLNLNPEVDFPFYRRHLGKSIWCHYSTAVRPITTNFGNRMQIYMSMTTHSSKSKPDVEFPYGGRSFSKTGSSHISVVDW